MSLEPSEVSRAEEPTTQRRGDGLLQRATNPDMRNSLPKIKPDKDFVAAFLARHKIASRERLKRVLLASGELQSFDRDHF